MRIEFAIVLLMYADYVKVITCGAFYCIQAAEHRPVQLPEFCSSARGFLSRLDQTSAFSEFVHGVGSFVLKERLLSDTKAPSSVLS